MLVYHSVLTLDSHPFQILLQLLRRLKQQRLYPERLRLVEKFLVVVDKKRLVRLDVMVLQLLDEKFIKV